MNAPLPPSEASCFDTTDSAYVLQLSKTESAYHHALQEVYFLVLPHEEKSPSDPLGELAKEILTKIRHLV